LRVKRGQSPRSFGPHSVSWVGLYPAGRAGATEFLRKTGRMTTMKETRRPFLKRALGTAGSTALGFGSSRGESLTSDAMAGASAPACQDTRRSFPFAGGHAYLNTATLGAASRQALDEVARGYQLLAADPETARTDLYGSVERSVRPALARLVGADPDEIALTS